MQQKQNYPGSVAFHDSQPGNEVGLTGLFYNGPEHHMGRIQWVLQKLTWYKQQ